MNLLINRPVLFVLLLLSVFACDNPNDLGTTYNGDLINTAYTETEPITAATVLVKDSIIAKNKGNLLAGVFTNEKFGTTTAKAYLEIGPSGGSIATGSTLDSIVLALDYDEAYGDTTTNYTLEVRELTKSFEANKTYYTNNNNELTYTTALGTATFIPKPKQTISKEITNAQGTKVTVKTSVPLRIKLNNELGQRIMSLPTTTLGNPTEFAKVFKGVVLVPGATNKAALGFAPDGALPNADSTYLRIYYKAADGKKQKYDLLISNATGGNNRFNEIISDPTGTALAALQKTGDSVAVTAANETYLQESTGLLTKITFPDLDKWQSRPGNENSAIIRAELIIPVKENGTSSPAPLAYLAPTTKNNRILRDANLAPRILLEDPLIKNLTGSNPNVATPAVIRYDKDKKAYIGNITQYVQSIVYQRPFIALGGVEYLISKSLVLVPTSGGGILESSGLHQSVLQVNGTDRIKLRIYFSRIN
ncbi:MAG: hypothetical protein AVDCRST_MAG95-3293 [uncultured Adhaeribacter sp.]|uniref:DUF4270 domain-containing protein n=1 Tax=uncultured Adhaeribacter sp. TaxID=448109 RepID=A0A6J4JKD4_9BACT|nr:MAG: hypothetical protein AVDCRST_MAG95-3293 [uncultured Adhaeribacter sp.]